MSESWFAEPPFAGYQQRFRSRERLHVERSDWQQVEVYDFEAFGRTLVLDGTMQTSAGEEFTYHEPLVHVPMFAHPNPRRVLIIGGGDGGALRHVLLHPTVERAVESEIDRAVVDVSLRYLPEISGGAYDDPRAELRVEDGARFMAETAERFDVIIVDSTDPVGPAEALIGESFLRAARGALASGGVMVMQSGSPVAQPREWVATQAAFRRVFPIVRPYLGWVPIYPSVVWSWAAGSESLDASQVDEQQISVRLEGLPERLRIYNAAIHRAAFALPNFVQRMVEYEHPPTRAELRAIGHPLPGVGAPD